MNIVSVFGLDKKWIYCPLTKRLNFEQCIALIIITPEAQKNRWKLFLIMIAKVSKRQQLLFNNAEVY